MKGHLGGSLALLDQRPHPRDRLGSLRRRHGCDPAHRDHVVHDPLGLGGLRARDPYLPYVAPLSAGMHRVLPRRAVEVRVLGAQVRDQRPDLMRPRRAAPVGHRRDHGQPATWLEHAAYLRERLAVIEPMEGVGDGDRLYG